jgi:hypothetical protein
MKKTNDRLPKEILFYARKLPPIKQLEALDFIKWLWGGPTRKEENLKAAVSKIREIQAKHKAYKGWDSVREIRKWRESH